MLNKISHRAFYNNSYYANDVAKFVHGGHPQVAVFGNYANVADNHGVGADQTSIVRSYSHITGSDSGGAVSTAGAQVGGIKFKLVFLIKWFRQDSLVPSFLKVEHLVIPVNQQILDSIQIQMVRLVPTEKVRITSEGNVGIGSTIPTSKLDIVGDVQVVGVVTAVHSMVMVLH